MLSIAFAALACNATAFGGVTADWDGTTDTLTVTLTSADDVEVTTDIYGYVQVKDSGVSIKIYEGMTDVSVDAGDVENLIVDGSSGVDDIDCADVSAIDGWTAVTSVIIDGNGGDDTIDGTQVADHIWGGTGDDTVDGKDGDDQFVDYDSNDDTMTSCGAVVVSWDSTPGILTIDAASGSTALDLEVLDNGTYATVHLGGHEIDMPPTVPAADVVTLNITGTNEADTIDCQEVTSANGFTSVDFVTIDSKEGDDELTGTEFRDRFVTGTGNDKIDGKLGTNYVIDFDSNDDTILHSSAKGLSPVWQWTAGDISVADWEDKVDAGEAGFVTHPEDPSNSDERYLISDSNGTSAALDLSEFGFDDTFMQIKINDVAPIMDSTTEALHCYVKDYLAAHDHSRILVRFKDDTTHPFDATNETYCKSGKRYRYEFKADLSSVTDWKKIGWVVLFQLHPGGWPGSPWVGGQAPFAVVEIAGNGTKAEWVGRVRGSTVDPPVSYTVTNYLREDFEIGDGEYTITIEWTLDYSGSDSYTRTEIRNSGGGLVASAETRATNAINYTHSGNSTAGACEVHNGIYTADFGSNDYPRMDISKVVLYSE